MKWILVIMLFLFGCSSDEGASGLSGPKDPPPPPPPDNDESTYVRLSNTTPWEFATAWLQFPNRPSWTSFGRLSAGRVTEYQAVQAAYTIVRMSLSDDSGTTFKHWPDLVISQKLPPGYYTYRISAHCFLGLDVAVKADPPPGHAPPPEVTTILASTPDIVKKGDPFDLTVTIKNETSNRLVFDLSPARVVGSWLSTLEGAVIVSVNHCFVFWAGQQYVLEAGVESSFGLHYEHGLEDLDPGEYLLSAGIIAHNDEFLWASRKITVMP